MVCPIFILGSNRNGTTWLTNVVASHPEVAAAQHRVHWGVKENSMHRHLQYWGDLTQPDRLIKFMELYSSGDHFRLARGDKSYFYQYRPTDFIDFFFEMMDRYAKKEKCRYWVTKLDTRFYSRPSVLKGLQDRIEKRYGDAKFISIKREFADVLSSYVNMQGRIEKYVGRLGGRELGIILNTARYASHYSTIEALVRSKNGSHIPFVDLKNRRKSSIGQIVRYLDVSFEEVMLEDDYPSNSSYRGKKEATQIPEPIINFASDKLLPFLRTTPTLANLIVNFRDATRQSDSPVHWRLLKYKHLSDEFERELRCSGRTGLHSVLFE